MSEISEGLQSLALNFANRQMSLEDFRQRFAWFYFQARQSRADERANALASKIMGPLSELARHHRSEDSFRQDLANAIRPLSDGDSNPVLYNLLAAAGALNPSEDVQ